jgi:hypothetical protein
MGSQKLLAELEPILGLAQELWPDGECTYSQIAWWAANIPHGETEVRVWRDGNRLVGWGWVTGGTELEFDVRPSHYHVLDQILEWAQPLELLVRSDHEDAIARIEAHGLVHDPDAAWIRLNARSLEQVDDPRVPDGYRLRTVEGTRLAVSGRGAPLGLSALAVPRGRLCPRAIDPGVPR